MTSEALGALEELATVLDRLGVPFVVGGSLASGAWGEPRSTHDVDILVRLAPQQARPLFQALKGDFYVDEEAIDEAVREARVFNVIHLKRYQKIDVFVAGSGALDRAQLERPVVRELGSSSKFPVTAPEIAVLRKLDWYWKGGEVSDRQWRDVQAILRVQRSRLDRGVMRDLAEKEGLLPLLHRALVEAYGDDV